MRIRTNSLYLVAGFDPLNFKFKDSSLFLGISPIGSLKKRQQESSQQATRSLYSNSQYSECQNFELGGAGREVLLPNQSPRTRIKTTATTVRIPAAKLRTTDDDKVAIFKGVNIDGGKTNASRL